MVRDDEPIRPMTLGGMHRGVGGWFATCQQCGHECAVNNMRDWPDDAPVPSFGVGVRCNSCGKLGATAVPNRIKRADRLPGGT